MIRPGEAPVPLFGAAVHLQEVNFESAEPNLANLARLATVTNRLALFVQSPGTATLQLKYRVPITAHERKKRGRIPVAPAAAGQVRVESTRNDLEIQTGSLWTKSAAGNLTAYEIGAVGEELLVIEWRDDALGLADRTGQGTREFYGIGLTQAQNLTVIHSDGSCTHFAEFEVPAFQKNEFQMRLPSGAGSSRPRSTETQSCLTVAGSWKS
ncbi:MAG: hypothetical protein FJ403_12155 [Verrucomicrobia bacterium]|nr:hypothetical protein [Verrucomicrobiota bacterium]